jgi:hypothetical protein
MRACELEATIEGYRGRIRTVRPDGRDRPHECAAQRALGYGPRERSQSLGAGAMLRVQTPEEESLPIDQLPVQRALQGETNRMCRSSGIRRTARAIWFPSAPHR